MKYDMEQSKELVDELVMLWSECSTRCDKINDLVKQIKESEK
jgi:hypothetical protein